MGFAGVASPSATERFRQRFAGLHPSHFRVLQDLWVSSIGVGTYLGDSNDRTDALYAEAIRAALSLGCNLLDTALNYRCQRSERTIGSVLSAVIAEGSLAREEVLVCTKGGYLPFDQQVPSDPARYFLETVVTPGLAPYEEIVAGCHCLTPAYLDHALAASVANLRVQTIDIYYLHNPEQQLEEISRDAFLQRLEAAFALLEQRARDGVIRCYGLATWNGLRCNPKARGYLALDTAVELARRVGGPDHRFRAVQLPYNLAMPEAFSFQNQLVDGIPMTVLQAAQRLGLSVLCSASLLQSRLTHLPESLDSRIPGLASAAQRAVQFVRSTPGVTTALVGMKHRMHVEENLALARQPVLSAESIQQVFDRTRR
ncbi:MAG: aldo/keto reductase [Candidatus Omnitrophica bacterium]|nr:aldo/keto reductase [Candidatus Omnitrophota bacterium]